MSAYRTPVRAVLIGNRDDTDPGLVGHALRRHGYSFTEFAREEPDSWSEPGSLDLVVSLGSSWSTYWPQVARETSAERDFLAAIHSRGVPILGICFGGQQLAGALGGTVERSQTHEVGWHAVSSIAEATVAGAEVLAGEWFQWHYDRFSVPAGATALAESPVSPQAFLAGRSLGLQFHPEVTVSIVGHWSSGEGEAELRQLGLDRSELLAETAAKVDIVVPRTHALVDWFVTNIAHS